EQIGKTSELCSYLNRFSHRMDYPMCTFSVNESLEELIVLINRFAHQKRIGLEKDFQKNLPMIYSDPSRIQLIIFSLIEEMINKYDKNSRIVIKTESLKDSLMVQITPKGNVVTSVGETRLSSFEILQDVIRQLGGNLFQDDKEVKITLPLSEQALTETN
ncbi:MAG: hypothetical protein OEW69_04545, partial [Nitrospirota bacterium]|nr:hypothetical protein [Nitrospirota bacterium]